MSKENVDKQFNRYLISSEDFLEAKEYLEALKENPVEVIVQRALLTAAIVCYARPFTNNSGSRENAIPVISQKFINNIGPKEKELHDKIIELRHKVVAHSDFDAKPCERGIEGTALMADVDVLKVGIDTELFHLLADSMAARCMKKNIELNRENPL